MSARFDFPGPCRFVWLLFLLLLQLAPATGLAFFGSRPAVEFPEGLEWLNVERPLTRSDLEGKVVILDFWTYGCINCTHVAEELRHLEEKFKDQLAVVGVHSPKFDNEKNLETLRNTVVRLDRRHAIVHDPDWRLMRRYGVQAWPTLAVFTPDGEWLGRAVGEMNEERLERAIDKVLELYADKMDSRPLPLALEQHRYADSLLAAPGKLAVNQDDSRVAVSDTLHHRIVLAQPDGKILQVFGGTDAGLHDGTGQEIKFNAPQGLAFSEASILVADAGNHAIRRIDLETGWVSTLAGTGRIGLLRQGEYDALHVDLRSPWDLALKDGDVYIAMAGNHQIWRLGLMDGKISPYAGSRREGIHSGPLSEASFSQPSGLALVDDDLYVADAEASAIRRIRMGRGEVENLVGKGLFDFGDQDGPLKKAMLQHTSGLAALGPKRLVLADTYNHKVKLLDLDAGRVTTVLGSGRPGAKLGGPGETEMNEPGGVAVLNGLVLVADTNNHRILEFSPESGEVREWPLRESDE